MAKILVIYHSQQYGDTKGLAEAVAEGVRKSGAGVELVNTNERRVTLDEYLDADAVALGTPDYFSYVAGTIKTFFEDLYLWDKAGRPVKGKPAVFFFSCGGGGRVKHPFETLALKFLRPVGETLESRRPATDEILEKCRALGEQLAKEIG